MINKIESEIENLHLQDALQKTGPFESYLFHQKYIYETETVTSR